MLKIWVAAKTYISEGFSVNYLISCVQLLVEAKRKELKFKARQRRADQAGKEGASHSGSSLAGDDKASESIAFGRRESICLSPGLSTNGVFMNSDRLNSSMDGGSGKTRKQERFALGGTSMPTPWAKELDSNPQQVSTWVGLPRIRPRARRMPGCGSSMRRSRRARPATAAVQEGLRTLRRMGRNRHNPSSSQLATDEQEEKYAAWTWSARLRRSSSSTRGVSTRKWSAVLQQQIAGPYRLPNHPSPFRQSRV
eukprot:scaffold7358_cov18-Tisochrysis_lutea.AAC.1